MSLLQPSIHTPTPSSTSTSTSHHRCGVDDAAAPHPIETDKIDVAHIEGMLREYFIGRDSNRSEQGAPLSSDIKPKLTPPALFSGQGAGDILRLNAEFGQLVKESSVTQMLQRSKQTQAVNEAMNQRQIDDADKADEARRKAEKIQSIWGKLFKVLTYALTAVSLVAAVFTGGATLVLTMAFIALEATLSLTTGKTLSEMAAGKVIEGVTKLVEVVSKKLEELGCDPGWAKGVAIAIAALVVIVGVVLASKAGAAAGRLAQAPLKMISKKLPTLYKRVALKRVTNLTDTHSLQTYASSVGHFSGAGSLTANVGYGAQNAAQKHHEVEATTIEAMLGELQANFDIHNETSAMSADLGRRAEELMQQLMASIGKVLNTENDVNVNIIANIRAA